MDALFEMELEVRAQDNLAEHEEVHGIGEGSMDVFRVEFTAVVVVTKEVAHNREDRGHDLHRNVPAVLDYL